MFGLDKRTLTFIVNELKFLKSYLKVKFKDTSINPQVIYLSKSIKTTMYSSRERERKLVKEEINLLS